MKRTHSWWFACLALLLLAPTLRSAQAMGQGAVTGEIQQPPAISFSVTAGFDGNFKEGQWLPLHVTVANDGADLQAVVRVDPVDTNGVTTIYERAVELPTQSRRSFTLYVPLQNYYSNSLKVTLVSGNTELAKDEATVRALSRSDLLVGVVAAAPSAYNLFRSLTPLNGSAYIAELTLADLPEADAAWQSLDVLVFSDVDTGALSPAQRAGLANWVAGGGRLFVMGGPSWQKTAAGLTELLPLQPTDARSFSLPGFAGIGAEPAPEGDAVVAVGTVAAEASVVVANPDGLPLVVARPVGFGKVFYFAADPAFTPLKNWDGLEPLYRQLLSGSDNRPVWAAGMRNWSEAQNALATLANLQLPNILLICGFLGAYLLIIGPVNYLVLRRLRRLELAWLTIPGIVLFFSVFTYVAGSQLRGAQPLLHQLAVVQVWPGVPQARVEAAIGLFSPRREDFSLAFPAGVVARPLPANTFGSFTSYTVQQGERSVFANLRLDVGEVESFVAVGSVPAPEFAAHFALDFAATPPTLVGEVTNHSSLTLHDAVLLGPGAVQTLGALLPNETRTINLPTTNARALPLQSSNPLFPIIPPVAGQGGSGPSFYPGSTYDNTLNDVMGSSYFYEDRQLYRRAQLLSSMLNDPYGYSSATRGAGLYLVGWATEAPLPAEVVGRSYATENETLYIIALPVTAQQSLTRSVVPPGLMTWTVVDTGASNTSTATPYDTYIYQGTDYALAFAPAQPLTFSTVEALTLHVTDLYNGASGPVRDVQISLWDVTAANWVLQTGLTWGDNVLPNPGQFVGPGGQIQVRIISNSLNSVNLTTLDFTLEVAP